MSNLYRIADSKKISEMMNNIKQHKKILYEYIISINIDLDGDIITDVNTGIKYYVHIFKNIIKKIT